MMDSHSQYLYIVYYNSQANSYSITTEINIMTLKFLFFGYMCLVSHVLSCLFMFSTVVYKISVAK